MTDADEAAGQHMKQKAPEKLFNVQRHSALLVLMCRIAPAERDSSIHERDKPVIRDGDSVRITAEIPQDVLGSAEWPLAVDHPILPVGLPN